MNWIEEQGNEDLLSEYTSKLAIDLATEAGHNFDDLTAEECQKIGSELTAAWFEGKSSEDILDYLVKEYGTETEKLLYNQWLIERS